MPLLIVLKPDRTRIALLTVMLVIALGGYTQSWAFSSNDAGLPPPPLAWLFLPIPLLWEAWVILLAPLVLTLRLVRLDALFNAGPAWLFWTLQVLWFYFLTACISLAAQKFANRYFHSKTSG